MNLHKIAAEAKKIRNRTKEGLKNMDLNDFSVPDYYEEEPLTASKMELPEYIASCNVEFKESESNESWLQREYGVSVKEFNQMLALSK